MPEIPGFGHVALTREQAEQIKERLEKMRDDPEVVYGVAPRELIYKMIGADHKLALAKEELATAEKVRDQVWQEIYDHIEDADISHKARYEDYGISIDRRNGNLTPTIDEHEALHEVLGEVVMGEGGVLATLFGEEAVAELRGEVDTKKKASTPDYQR